MLTPASNSFCEISNTLPLNIITFSLGSVFDARIVVCAAKNNVNKKNKVIVVFIVQFLDTKKAIKLKVAVMQNFVAKGAEGETMFWQTKGRITYGIVNYTEEQNPIFKDLFKNQYKELLVIYNKMNVFTFFI